MEIIVNCPECGSPLELVTDGEVGRQVYNAKAGRVEMRLERRRFAACTGCEYCVDLELIQQEG